MFNRTGVYIIENKINGKSYIGSTKQSFKRRLGNHMLDLKKGLHHSIKLQRAYNKYGIDSFSIRILELCDKDNAREVEQEWFDRMSPEYNMTLVVNETKGMLGRFHTEETKDLMSKASKGIKKSKTHRKAISEEMKRQWESGERVQSVLTDNTKVNMARAKFEGILTVLDKSENEIMSCWSISDASYILNIKAGSIAAVSGGQRNSVYGYKFNKQPLESDFPRLKSKEDLKVTL
jgi:group I intron endonuclease